MRLSPERALGLLPFRAGKSSPSRPKARTLLPITALFLCLCLGWSSEAHALRTIIQDGTRLSFPEGEEAIAAALVRQTPDMCAFLARKGLLVHTPLHIILDDKLDAPEAIVSMIPHREIRIPLRAPGVLEDGYLEADPWSYFLFRGLCLQGLYGLRGGIPQLAYHVFGEVISPNAVIPQWLEDGICILLYRSYSGKESMDPYAAAVFAVSPLPDMARLSNHPGVWPGYYAHRIYGRPFIAWVYEQYGWDKLLAFMNAHGAGIIPIEIDLKAEKTFGKTWVAIWNDFRTAQAINPGETFLERKVSPDPFQRTFNRSGLASGSAAWSAAEPDASPEPIKVFGRGMGEPFFKKGPPGFSAGLIDGFWPEPFQYWNVAGIYPGMERYRLKGRYGYRDAFGTLWISEYNDEDRVRITGYRDGTSQPIEQDHLWDPGVGDIAVSRQGHRPVLVALETQMTLGIARIRRDASVIPGPPGAIALSGPVRNARGEIAVAANCAGNWDIWTYNGAWRRVTDAPSVELDPWWNGDALVFASNASGSFQIRTSGMQPLTDSTNAVLMPRSGQCLELGPAGWCIASYPCPSDPPALHAAPAAPDTSESASPLASKPYTPWASILPNYIVPDIYIGSSDIQLGLATRSRDVTRDYTTDAGIRYSFDEDYLSLRLGGRARYIAAQGSRYPLSYDSNLAQTDESRREIKLALVPFLDEPTLLEISLNQLTYEPLEDSGPTEHELWGAVNFRKEYGNLFAWGTFETYSGDRQSLYGGMRVRWGKDIFGILQLQGGKTWEGYTPGHGSFRIGGDTGEGYFTQRPSRLFPLRGFSSNTLEAGQAVISSVEIYWPLANIQQGYETLPLFLHKLRLGTFVDAGACRDSLHADDILVGAGIELLTSLEIAWGNYSSFRMGVAWPVSRPDYLDESGPVFLLQIGRPL